MCYRIKLVLGRLHRALLIGRMTKERGSFRGCVACGMCDVPAPFPLHWMASWPVGRSRRSEGQHMCPFDISNVETTELLWASRPKVSDCDGRQCTVVLPFCAAGPTLDTCFIPSLGTTWVVLSSRSVGLVSSYPATIAFDRYCVFRTTEMPGMNVNPGIACPGSMGP